LEDLHLLLSPFAISLYLVNCDSYLIHPEIINTADNLECYLIDLIDVLKKQTLDQKHQRINYHDSMDVLAIEVGNQYNIYPETIQEILESFSDDSYLCGIPGCKKSANISGYCCYDHFNRGEKAGYLPSLSIGIELALVSSVLSDSCWSAHLMTNLHPSYTPIKEQFTLNWLHPNYGKPVIQRIYKLKSPSHIFYRFKDKETEMDSEAIIQFHGTYHSENCHFGLIPTGRPCDDSNCCVCSICTHSFSLRRANSSIRGGQQMALRYGQGLYFSPVSSKSHDYTNSRPYHQKGFYLRSIFLCKVIPGRRYVTLDGFMHEADCPPKG
jgi:hypothetical protein